MEIRTVGVVGRRPDGQRHRPRRGGRRLPRRARRRRGALAREGARHDREEPRPPGRQGQAHGRGEGRGARRLAATTRARGARRRDLVVEAVVENEAVKQELFGKLDAICRPAAILASNTSSISITRLAAATRRPDRFIGMHFMNPVPVMQLVEVIRGIATSDETAARRRRRSRGGWARRRSSATTIPGFVSNRVLMPMINEAIEACARASRPARRSTGS